MQAKRGVTVGKVVGVYSRYEEVNFGIVTRYVIEIKVDKVEKGDGPQSGKMLYVHNWEIKKITNMDLLEFPHGLIFPR